MLKSRQDGPRPQLSVQRTIGNRRAFRGVEPTPPDVFFNRRDIIRQMGLAGLMTAGALSLPRAAAPARAADDENHPALKVPITTKGILEKFPAKRNAKFAGKGVELTDRLVAATHNNFYEFLPGRGGRVYLYAGKFQVEPWKVEVTGACMKPQTFDLDDIMKFDQEERVYHFRCVETWAMDVPWTGFPISKLLEKVQPKDSAKFVKFYTAEKRNEMPGIQWSIELQHGYAWPYHEALRMDEAMNELALIVTGLYGKPLLKQHGAPVRVIVPWKYGYKSPKSIVKIELVEEQPKTFWARDPYLHEYGFLSNVNPNVPHPRWSQAFETMLVGDTHPRGGPRKATKLLNGYEGYVGKLYPNEPKTPQQPLGPDQVAR